MSTLLAFALGFLLLAQIFAVGFLIGVFLIAPACLLINSICRPAQRAPMRPIAWQVTAEAPSSPPRQITAAELQVMRS
jgi:hypothetical protein